MTQPYRGRFAPSPSGPLHFGSLVAAVASFVDARAHNGRWLLRIEDIDPPREQAGAADAILRTLEAHQLHWDEPVLYQSTRTQAYRQALSELQDQLYRCQCNRQRLASLGGPYDRRCLHQPPPTDARCALRIRYDPSAADNTTAPLSFDDVIQGKQYACTKAQDDFILVRKDGLFAYQLAVAVDDGLQKINHVIRGSDLLDSTFRQGYLLTQLGIEVPQYGHLPLVVDRQGEKLCKQHGAAALDNRRAPQNIAQALVFLGHRPPAELVNTGNSEDLLLWAAKNWQRQRIPLTNNAILARGC